VSGSGTAFTENTLRFLRRLKRNNTRAWFNEHRDEYESHVREPMLAVIERLTVDFPRIAPDLVASPRSMYRVYRDTRFSPDKTPYKTQVAAAFSHQALSKNESAALYFHLAPDQLWIGGGLYAPQTAQLHRIRKHIDTNLDSFLALVKSSAIRRIGGVTGSELKRVPRGFSPDHKAADYLRLKQYLAGETLPPELALSPRFYNSLVRRFSALVPFIRFLNAPLASEAAFLL